MPPDRIFLVNRVGLGFAFIELNGLVGDWFELGVRGPVWYQFGLGDRSSELVQNRIELVPNVQQISAKFLSRDPRKSSSRIKIHIASVMI
jgi:hypothetical protein